MDLLPRSVDEFRKAQYWDTFFKKRGKDGTFEWYGEYNDLCGVLDKYCKEHHRTLVVGCGNSRLSEDLYDVGYRSLINIDISDVAVRQMAERNAQRRPEMKFMKMDMRDLTFDDGHFDCVLDKATLDAIMAEDSEAINNDVTKIFQEVTRVLKSGGRYICVSLAQSHILEKLLSYFPENWFVRVHKVEKKEDSKRDGSSGKFALPVFVFVFTKKASTAMPQVLELCLHGKDLRPERVGSVDKFRDGVKETQNFALLWQRLRNIHAGEEAQFDLWAAADASAPTSTNREPRFTLHIVDSKNLRAKGLFAMFIAPQGSEMDYLYSTPHGRMSLAEDAGYRRLVVVLLRRGHKYGSLADVREELASQVGDLIPEGGRSSFPVLGIDEETGERNIVCTGSSDLSGDYIVEDFRAPNKHWHRRLVFLSNRNVIQSEARLYKDAPEESTYHDRPLPPVPTQPPPQLGQKAALSKNQKKKARKAKAKANKSAAATAGDVAGESAESTTTTTTNGSSTTATADNDGAAAVNGEASAACPSTATASSVDAAVASEDSGCAVTTSAAATASSGDSAATAAVATPAVATSAQGSSDNEDPVDTSFLACDHHKAMVCGLAVVRGLPHAPAGSHKALLVGLGGGGLPRFIHSYVPPVSMEVVELDPKILDISRDWFGLREDSRLTVHIDDGLKFIGNLAEQDPKPHYSAIMFDVDGKDTALGMSCPPPAFVEREFLEQVKAILHPHGVFILNLVCRDTDLQDSILSRMSSVFANAYWLDISGELNKIIVAVVKPLPCMHTDPDLDIHIMDWVKRSGGELEQVIANAAPPTARATVQFINSTFKQLQTLR